MNLRPPGYEPGELPDCSTPRRRRKDSISPMPWWTWLCLGILALSLLATAIFTAVAVTRLKRLAALAEAIRVQLDELARAGEELERRMAHAEERAAEFEQHRAQLDRSLARLPVLTSALSEARAGVTRFQKAYLRK